MNFETLKKRIQKKLKEKNLSITNAEKLAGIGRGSLWYFLDGRTKSPSLENLYAISKILDCSLAELLEINSQLNIEGALKTFNLPLYNSIIELATKFILEKNLSLESEIFLKLVKDIYYFCLSEKLGILDKEFAIWHLKTNLKC